MANERWNGNFINNLKINGVWMKEEEELKNGILSYFKFVFKNP